MLTRRGAMAGLAIFLAGCGGEGELRRDLPESAETRPLIEEVVALDGIPNGTGLVVRATGRAPVQGYWDGALVPVPDPDPQRLSFAFRAAEPPRPELVSTDRSREITVGLTLTERQIRGIREIRVTGERNSLILQR